MNSLMTYMHGAALENMRVVSQLHERINAGYGATLTMPQAMAIAGAFSQLVGDNFLGFTSDYVADLLASAFDYAEVPYDREWLQELVEVVQSGDRQVHLRPSPTVE